MAADIEQQTPSSSAKAQIARAAGLVMALFVVSRALGLFREIVISYQFGTGGDLDAYLAAFRLPDILFQLVAGGALASAFIPTFSGYLAGDDKSGAWRLASAIINLVLLITTALAALAAALASWLKGANLWFSVGVSIGVGLAVYAGLSLALGAPEPRSVWSMVRSR